MKISWKILIISLIFTFVSYIVLYIRFSYFFANSFLAGALASLIDIFVLARLAGSILGTGIGWLFLPLGLFRWIIFALAIFVALRYYKAMPLPLLIGAGIPLAALFLLSLYHISRGGKNGASS